MNLLNEKLTKKIGYIPSEVVQFIENYNAIGFDFLHCNINVEEYSEHLIYDIVENRVNLVFEEQNTPKRTIQVSYRNGLVFDDFLSEYEIYQKDLSIDREIYVERFINNVLKQKKYGDDMYYREIVSEYIKKHSCEATRENILKALTQKAEDLYGDEVLTYNDMSKVYNEILKTKDNLSIKTIIDCSDIYIIHSKESIKGGIFTPDGEIIVITVNQNEEQVIDSISMNLYSVSEISHLTDGVINYNVISPEWLASLGMTPTKSEVIDFNLLLKESNLEELQKNPVAAIYRLKDVLISKTIKNKNSNNSIK